MELVNKPRYVALLDILGFKESLRKMGSTKLAKIYKSCLDRVYGQHIAEHQVTITTTAISLKDSSETILEARKETHKAFPHLERPVVFSDSIILFSVDDSKASLFEIVNFANISFQEFLKEGLPIRGAISFGDCVIDADAGLYVSEGIVQAYTIEQSLDIIGIVVDPSIAADAFDFAPAPVALKNNSAQEFRIPKFSPEGFAGHDIYVMWARFDECFEHAPKTLKQRYRQSEEIFSIMVSGKANDYDQYRKNKRLGNKMQASGLLDD